MVHTHLHPHALTVDGYATFDRRDPGHIYGRCGKKHNPARPTGGLDALPLDGGHSPAMTMS
jgi:hypothetical protein